MFFLDTERSYGHKGPGSAIALAAWLMLWSAAGPAFAQSAKQPSFEPPAPALAPPPPPPARAPTAPTRCRVSDPTGTPLNIRAWPNGAIKGQIRNGVLVAVEDQQRDDRGRPWALIRSRDSGDVYGWVFREFIACF